MPDPGGVQLDPADPDAVFGFVADNQRKGISRVPAVTLHATWAWSAERWDVPDGDLVDQLVTGASDWFDPTSIVSTAVRRWRFAAPADPWPEPCWIDDEHRVVVAGDLFAGPKVEGAHDSGIAAAEAVDSFMSR
jgi:predicted NAD/FAD-dependent oxidoreductase